MIHNNLRKLIRRYAFIGSSSSNTKLEVVDYTDHTGYTGSDETDDIAARRTLSEMGSCITGLISSQPTTIAISSAWSGSSTYAVIQLGNTSVSEPDYTLGTILSNNCSYTLVASYELTPIITGTIINTTNNDISFNEVGLFLHISNSQKWNGVTNNNSQRNFLLIKEILPQSMTLEAQSSVTFSFNILGDVTT